MKEEGIRLVHREQEPGDDGQAGQRDTVEHDMHERLPARRGWQPGLPSGSRQPDEGKGGAEQEARQARVGAVIDPRDVALGLIQDAHPHGGEECATERDDEEHPPPDEP